MKKAFFASALTFFLILTVHANQDQKPSIFIPDDNVCFIGNSITHNGYHTYYLMLYYITRFPGMKINFCNLGLSGDTSNGINKRMKEDILSVNPSVSVVMAGMNDVGRSLYNPSKFDPDKEKKVVQKFETYKTELTKMLDTLSSHSRKLIIFTPSIFDQTMRSKNPNLLGVNDELFKYGEYIKSISAQYGASVVDMWDELTFVNELMQREDSSATIIGPDRIHPYYEGGYVMAYRFLKDLKEPEYVSYMEIDAAKKHVVKSLNSEITILNKTDASLHFNILEASLPFPADEYTVKTDKYIGFQDKFNLEILKITGLKKGNFKLLIDTVEVGTYSAGELSKGINLAGNSATPQYKQAEKVAGICAEHRQESRNYRFIRTLEHLQMKDMENMKSIDECMNFARNLLETAKDRWWKTVCEYYIKNKPKQQEIPGILSQMVKKAYLVAQPVSHTYQLIEKE